MKQIRRVAAGVLAAAAVLAPAAARADTPYAQASATVDEHGSVKHGKHVTDVWHPYQGIYCVGLDETVDLEGPVAIQVTPIGHYDAPRSLSVDIGAPTCGQDRFHTIAVYSQLYNGRRAEVAFLLSVS